MTMPETPVSPKTLGVLFEFTYNVAKQNIDGFSHEDSLRQPKDAGNCLNWVLGHIVAERQGMLKWMGQDPLWSDEDRERYGRGSDPIVDASEAVKWDKILQDLEATQELIRAALRELTPETLTAPIPQERNFLGLDSLGEMFAAYTFHEAYHAGQTGILRRILGREGVIG